jgi:hypothetical protein
MDCLPFWPEMPNGFQPVGQRKDCKIVLKIATIRSQSVANSKNLQTNRWGDLPPAAPFDPRSSCDGGAGLPLAGRQTSRAL